MSLLCVSAFFCSDYRNKLSEYLRRRRLSCAAYDLQHSHQRILDIAVKYGYDSADAFAAAFKRMHGKVEYDAYAGFTSIYPAYSLGRIFV